jgi:hypothetical protein
MSPSAEIVWLSHEPGSDPMREFGGEDSGPVDTRALRRTPGSLLQPVPMQPLPAAPPLPVAARPAPPAAVTPETSPFTPVEPLVVAEPLPALEPEPQPAPASAVTEGAPVAAAPVVIAPAAAGLAVPAQHGRWFVWMTVLALLTLVQAPFVVLWALQAANGAPPLAIEVTKPPIAFASTTPVPVERTLPAPRPRPTPPAPRPIPAGALSGFVRVEVPIAMRITEDGRLLGTTDVDRLMLPTGDHTLDLRSDELGFTTRQTVTIKAGETATVSVRLPSAPISINAKPWAEAWVDGERVGDTPIGTLMRTIGRHEVVLRHPELGERRVPVTVTLAQPARVSVDFRAEK